MGVLRTLKRKAKGMSEQEYQEYEQRQEKRKQELQLFREEQELAFQKAKVKDKLQRKLGREHQETVIRRGKKGTTVTHKYRTPRKQKRGGMGGLMDFGRWFLTGEGGKQSPKPKRAQPRKDVMGIHGQPPDLFELGYGRRVNNKKRRKS